MTGGGELERGVGVKIAFLVCSLSLPGRVGVGQTGMASFIVRVGLLARPVRHI